MFNCGLRSEWFAYYIQSAVCVGCNVCNAIALYDSHYLVVFADITDAMLVQISDRCCHRHLSPFWKIILCYISNYIIHKHKFNDTTPRKVSGGFWNENDILTLKCKASGGFYIMNEKLYVFRKVSGVFFDFICYNIFGNDWGCSCFDKTSKIKSV